MIFFFLSFGKKELDKLEDEVIIIEILKKLLFADLCQGFKQIIQVKLALIRDF